MCLGPEGFCSGGFGEHGCKPGRRRHLGRSPGSAAVPLPADIPSLRYLGAEYIYLLCVDSARRRGPWHVRLSRGKSGAVEIALGIDKRPAHRSIEVYAFTLVGQLLASRRRESNHWHRAPALAHKDRSIGVSTKARLPASLPCW